MVEKKFDKEKAEEIAEMSAFIHGCTCDEIEIAVKDLGDGVTYVRIGHDEGCPANPE